MTCTTCTIPVLLEYYNMLVLTNIISRRRAGYLPGGLRLRREKPNGFVINSCINLTAGEVFCLVQAEPGDDPQSCCSAVMREIHPNALDKASWRTYELGWPSALDKANRCRHYIGL